MTPDPNTQAERQLWAAYRLILSWQKREVVQREAQQSDGAGSDAQQVEQQPHNESDTVKQ